MIVVYVLGVDEMNVTIAVALCQYELITAVP
jgi:hypothetical protein